MCAITGIVHFDHRPVAESELVTMRDVMVNRGPEHGGQWLGGHAALAIAASASLTSHRSATSR